MKRLITGFGLTLMLLVTLGAVDIAQAAGPFSPLKGPSLPPGPDGNTPVWRVQLYMQVCDLTDAGTDNKVLAALNNANYTVMDSPVNDFERATGRVFDLLLTGVAKLADIQYLKIFKGGSDGVCLSQLIMYVNEREIYARTVSPSQRWLDDQYYGYDSRTLPIPGTTLRLHGSWQAWTAPSRPRHLSPPEIGSRLATAIGTGMYDFNIQSIHRLSWSSDYPDPGCGAPTLCAQALDPLAMRVRFVLDFKCIDPLLGDHACGDSKVDYWADLRLSCTPAGAIVATKESDGGTVINYGINSAAGELGAVRQFVGSRLPQAFLNMKVPNCAPIFVVPVNGVDGIDLLVQF